MQRIAQLFKSTRSRPPSLQILIFAGLVGLLAGCAHYPYANTTQGQKQGLVIQMTDGDPAKWNQALNNAQEAQQVLGKENVNIEIVTFGPGINMYKKESVVGPRLEQAQQNGVKLYACGNTMKALKINKEDLHPSVDIVKAGLIEVANKQQEGYAYVKP